MHHCLIIYPNNDFTYKKLINIPNIELEIKNLIDPRLNHIDCTVCDLDKLYTLKIYYILDYKKNILNKYSKMINLDIYSPIIIVKYDKFGIIQNTINMDEFANLDRLNILYGISHSFYLK